MNTETAVAWTLESPSATGGKEYRILVFDRFIVVGWGSKIGTMQYKVNKVGSPEMARNLAVEQTAKKEKAGYYLVRGPVRSHLSAEQWTDDLPKITYVRGGSPFMDRVFQVLYLEGSPLAS